MSKKQIKDFNILTNIVVDSDNIILQRDNGTTFRTHVVNLPFATIHSMDLVNTNLQEQINLNDYAIEALQSSSGRLENEVSDILSTVNYLYGSFESTAGRVDNDIKILHEEIVMLQSTSGYLEHSINNLKYQTIEVIGSPAPKRPSLNFSSQFLFVDNGGNNSTDIGINAINWDKITNRPVTLEGYGIIDGRGTNGGVTIVPTSYDELVYLKGTSGLITGAYYIIEDYRTCYDQPDYDYNGNPITSGIYRQSEVEPIIVLATSFNTIDKNAYQPKYPNDKIQYDISFSVTEITGNKEYGRIIERLDEFGNRTDYDHRTILFKRYRTYFYDLTSPLAGLINVSGSNAVGTNTFFTENFNTDSIIYVGGNIFQVVSIIDDTHMELAGANYIYENNMRYYYASTEIDGSTSNIPYTHTQMTGMPSTQEATSGQFLMDGIVSNGDADFGVGSKYFTNLYPGLFLMCAYNISIDEFSIQGDVGISGTNFNTYEYSTSFMDIDYSAYVKRLGGTTSPSINQIIIFNTSSSTGLVQKVSTNLSNDLQIIDGIENSRATQLHYLLMSKPHGEELSNIEIQNIVNTYIGLIDPNSIENTLSYFNSNYTKITSIPDTLYLFNDIGSSGEIDNGGNNIYDGANYIYTNIGEKYKCYDWKMNNIINDEVHRYFKTFQNDTEFIYSSRYTTKDNYIGDHSMYYNSNISSSFFRLANNVFGLYSYSNTLGERCFNNTTYNWFNKNRITGTFQRNVIKRGFYSNRITEYFTDNIINGYSWGNNIGDSFSYNETGDNFYDNIINNYFSYNSMTCVFYRNNIGINCENNIFHKPFYSNIITHDCYNNVVYPYFYGNKIGEQFQNNTLGDGSVDFSFYDNIIGNRFKGSLILGNFYGNNIGLDFYSNTINDSFYYNTLDNMFTFNNIDVDCYNNKFGSVIVGNHIGQLFNNNNIIGNFYSNTILNNFQFNNIEYTVNDTDFTSATFVYNSYTCTIIQGSNSTNYLYYFDGTSFVFVNITA